ncbi:MAG: alpha-N-arabinofuranosidase [Streptosporangiaceae bacterium]
MVRIDVLADRAIGTLDRRVFGSFTEHLGRCIYGGVLDEGSPLSGPDGFRGDVLAAVADLGVTNVRWPGGNFVSGYHWTDGIGSPDDRPRRAELAWHGEESNRFGTDEFMAWCAAAAVEPVLCLNMGTGTLDEALAWVEYCNGTGDTYWANRRRANGHAEPYGVRYWGLGNEMYGAWQIGQRTAAEYVTLARRWARALKMLDPGISLVSCGQSGIDDWDRVVIDGLAREVDWHSIHLYTGSADYWSNVLAPHHAERALSAAGAMIDLARYTQRIEHEISVAYDEWNVWYRTSDGRLEERYNLADALAVATYLNVFVRNCRTVRMANLAQLVNVIAPIVTSPGGMFFQSIYYPFQLMAASSQQIALDTVTDSGTHAFADRSGDRWPYRIAALGPFQLLDVAATRDSERTRLTVSVVNRDPGRALATRIRLLDAEAAGVMTVHEVNGDDPEAVNSFAHPHAVTARRSKHEVTGGDIDVTFAPHSFTVLEVQLA